ncbi:MAG TPA: AsmA family protein [Candidatus Sulfotelmatobacter sp.]|nr:AsmA family protein [Candidatus Sulfotelmatobacter sp.]
MKVLSSKSRFAVLAVFVLLALFLVRPGASQLKSRIINSLSTAVGRSVDIGSIHIRLLPRPGFDLENLVVYDDPAFGSEPMLRASEVTADLRLTSLLRGRLEVSKLDLTEPSLNLVHRVGGGWNLESLLERTARTPLAPTGKTKSEPRVGFPYIEGSSGRINFKNGPEKKPYALTNADFALWQDSENVWGVRLKAQPFRSDMNLNDMGLLQVGGTWQRSGSFLDTPLQFSIEWSQAQLGQLTKFFTGNDKGWRGDLRLDATVTGTPAALQISSTVLADDFRRYDIPSDSPLRLAARCETEYSPHEHMVHGISCSAPVGTGLITLAGEASLPVGSHYLLKIAVDDIPASAIGALARHVKKDLPDDLSLEGSLQGELSFSANAGTDESSHMGGQGQITGLRISSALEKVELGPANIPIVVTGPKLRARSSSVQGIHAEFGPFALERGRTGATVRGWADHSGYDFNVLGDAEIGKTLHVARVFGLRSLRTTAEGTAQLNLQIGGPWVLGNGLAGFASPEITGSAKLRNVRFDLRSGGEPVEITSGEMQLSADAVRVGKLIGRAAGATWRGSIEIPRGCGHPENCPVRFQLNTDQISLADGQAWANPKNRPWYRVLGSAQPAPSLLTRVWALGRLTADRFVLRGISVSKLSAVITLNAGKLEISSVDGDLLGGMHRGKWQADFSVKPAVCSGSGNLAGISLANISQLMSDDWVEGSASTSYDIRGTCTSDFWQSAEGTIQVNAADGSLPHVFLDGTGETLKIRKFTAQVQLHAGKIDVSDGELDSPEGRYEVSGSATFKRQIDFKLARIPAGAGSAYTVTGTVAQPRVAPVNGPEQARLKTPTK